MTSYINKFFSNKFSDPTGLKISLIMLPQWNISQPPLGIAYLASFLRSKGFIVEQRDLSVELFHHLPKEKKYLMESESHLAWIHNFSSQIYPQIKHFVDVWVKEMACGDSQILGFSVLSTNKEITECVIRRIKEKNPGKIIVIGGPQASRYEDGFQILDNEAVDYIVTDEGEETLYELACAIMNNSEVQNIKGILFKKNGQKIDTGERPLIPSLDSLPFPSLSDFPLDWYKDITLPILSSRGCLYKCSFCSEHIFWKLFRYRSGCNVYKEFKHQFSRTERPNFYMVDSLINGNIEELQAFCDFVDNDINLKVYWGGKAAIRKQMTPDLLHKLYNSGNRSIQYGLESGSEKVLRNMRKSFNIELAKRVIKDTYNAGIAVGLFWIIGFPTEEENDFQESLQFLNEIKDYISVVTPGYGCGVLKGSELFKDAVKYGIEFKEDGWYSHCTSPVIRAQRLERFKQECVRLRIKTG